MSRGVGHRRGMDPTVLWLWRRSAAAASIQPLAWELSYAEGVALKRLGKKKFPPERKTISKINTKPFTPEHHSSAHANQRENRKSSQTRYIQEDSEKDGRPLVRSKHSWKRTDAISDVRGGEKLQLSA